ncbi:MAG TPA: hypothetical protein VFQ79_10840 [Bryobacteraceae bacterium]|nr:hypothetical protein [Bryobacteraceae bacterium]
MTYAAILIPLLPLAGALFGQPAYFESEPPAPVWQPSMETDARYHGQHVFLSPDHTEIILRYSQPGETGPKRMVLRVRIKNRIAPEIKVDVSRGPGGGYVYRYAVTNAASASDTIWTFGVVVPVELPQSPLRRESWIGPSIGVGLPSAVQILAPGHPAGRLAIWFPHLAQGGRAISPGGTENGFILETSYRPGFTTSQLSDSADRLAEWPHTDEHWPDEVASQLDGVLRWVLSGRSYVTIGPVFAPDETPEVVARRLKEALDLLEQGKVIDPGSPFISGVHTLLDRIQAVGIEGAGPIESSPSTRRERELADVLRLSLGIGALQ